MGVRNIGKGEWGEERQIRNEPYPGRTGRGIRGIFVGKKKKKLYELTKIKRNRKLFPSKFTGFKLSQHF